VLPWRPPASPLPGAGLVRADPLHAWLIGGPYLQKNQMRLQLLATQDGGHSWQARPMPCNRTRGDSMSAQLVPTTAAGLWLFCASEPSAGTQGKAVFRSADGGGTWREIADSSESGGNGPNALPAGGYFANAAVTTRSDAWLALRRGTLMHTRDGGHTWHAAIPYPVANPGDGGVGPVQFVDQRHGWLFSFPDLLFRTRDGGKHWKRIRSHSTRSSVTAW
jgi:photosystem II stability/assembly factor-like uncharacterized protein